MRRLLIFLFLPCLSLQASGRKKEVYVTDKNNQSFRVDGYSSYRNFLSDVERLISCKIKDTYYFALEHSKIHPSALLSKTTPAKLILLQLLQSFDIKNRTFDTFLLDIADKCTFDTPQNFITWFDNSFNFPPERVYKIFKFIADTEPVLHKKIADQIFYVNVKYKVFEKAVATDDIEVVKWLLKHSPSDFSIESKVIEDAWKSGKIEFIGLLMKYNKINNKNLPLAVVNERFKNNETLLHIASRFGYTDSVLLLVSNIGANVNVKDAEGWSPLYRAVENNKYSVIEKLVVRGANMTSEPLLSLAVHKGHMDSIKYLLNFGVPFQVKDVDGQTPFFVAANNNNIKILEILGSISGPKNDIINSTNEFGDTLMHVAASNGFIDSVKTLFYLGVPINAKNDFDETILYKAVGSQNLDLIKLLIELKADIKIPTKTGDTIMHLAATLGNMDIIKFLLSKKVRCRIDVRNVRGETPVYKAAISGNSEVLKYLVDNGGDLYSNTEGMTMLHDAAAEGNEKAITSLIDRGIQVDALGFWDTTALHLATGHGHHKIVQILLEKKANPNSKTKNLWTPLHRAVLRDDAYLVKLLINNGADMTVKNDAGESPYTLALKRGKSKAADVFREVIKNI